jgi:hypothetical protein
MHVKDVLSNNALSGTVVEVEGLFKIDPPNGVTIVADYGNEVQDAILVGDFTLPTSNESLMRVLGYQLYIPQQPSIHGHVQVKGRLQRTPEHQMVMTDVQYIILHRFESDYTIHIRPKITFEGINPRKAMSVSELMRNLNTFIDTQVRLSGVITGRDRPEELSYLIDSREDLYNSYAEINNRILIRRMGILGDNAIIPFRGGGPSAFFAIAAITGTLEKSSDERFVAALTDVKDLAIKSGEHLIKTWNFERE